MVGETPNQVRYLAAGKGVRPFQEVRPLVVQDEQGDGVEGIGAGDRSADQAGHDVSAVGLGLAPRGVRELAEGEPRDPRPGEGQDRFLLPREGQRSLAAPIGERPAVQLHPEGEPS